MWNFEVYECEFHLVQAMLVLENLVQYLIPKDWRGDYSTRGRGLFCQIQNWFNYLLEFSLFESLRYKISQSLFSLMEEQKHQRFLEDQTLSCFQLEGLVVMSNLFYLRSILLSSISLPKDIFIFIYDTNRFHYFADLKINLHFAQAYLVE